MATFNVFAPRISVLIASEIISSSCASVARSLASTTVLNSLQTSVSMRTHTSSTDRKEISLGHSYSLLRSLSKILSSAAPSYSYKTALTACLGVCHYDHFHVHVDSRGSPRRDPSPFSPPLS